MQAVVPSDTSGSCSTDRPAFSAPSVGWDSWIQSGQNNEKMEKDCVIILRPLVKVSRIFGILPISFKENKIRFQWRSFLAVYAVAVVCVMCTYMAIKAYFSIASVENYNPKKTSHNINSVHNTEDIHKELNISLDVQEQVQSIESCNDNFTVPTFKKNQTIKKSDIVSTLQDGFFYGFSLSGFLLFLRATPMVVNLLERWCTVEGGLGTDVPNARRWPLFLGLSVLGLSAAGETITSMIYNEENLPPFWPYLESYIKAGNREIVEFFGYSKPLGILIVVINKYSTFIWNFVDVFIATTAFVLWRHFKAYNRKLQRELQGSSKRTEGWWRGAREQHYALQELVEATDAITGPLVLQSYVCNLFFILMQLYSSLKPRENPTLIKRIYLVWSFLHLLCRLLFVSFTCASLHLETIEPTTLLLSLPTESLNVEVDRFMQQIQVRPVGLTGWGFFFVNKNFILAPRQPCRQRDSNPGLPARKQTRSPVDQADVIVASVNVADVNVTDVNVADVNVADVNVADVNVTDVNVADVNVADVNVADVNVADVNVADVDLMDVHVDHNSTC
ncbi:Gustatory receptor [Trinorchestia longiramus]|nr:Gustatory receptor [Trinorchestia longiramus]